MRARRTLLWIAAGCASFAACASDDATRGGSPAGERCVLEALTQACTCDGVPGRQVCMDGAWSGCQCTDLPDTLPPGQAGSGAPVPQGNTRADITFDWQETAADGLPCQAGRYEGTFLCQFESMPVMPTGPVTMQLEMSADGEFLDIRDGVIDAQSMGPMLHADLEGQLDCTSQRFEANMLNGMVALIPGVPFNTFEGTLTGDYEPTTATITGDWTVMTAQGWMCIGTWTATRVP